MGKGPLPLGLAAIRGSPPAGHVSLRGKAEAAHAAAAPAERWTKVVTCRSAPARRRAHLSMNSMWGSGANCGTGGRGTSLRRPLGLCLRRAPPRIWRSVSATALQFTHQGWMTN